MSELTSYLTKKQVRQYTGIQHSALVYTFSSDLRNMAYLIENLPNVKFYIAAPVMVAESITALLAYPNISVLSDIAGQPSLVESLIERCDFLLDINAESLVVFNKLGNQYLLLKVLLMGSKDSSFMTNRILKRWL